LLASCQCLQIAEHALGQLGSAPVHERASGNVGDPNRDGADPCSAGQYLGGRNDLAWPRFFNERFRDYSNDGQTLPGAYGHRWRAHFERPTEQRSKPLDQFGPLIALLKRDPETRRAVLTMWDPNVDFNDGSLDLPCNSHIYFDCRQGQLNMTVCCRSNDAVWGAYGANAVHFSMLQEYIAAAVGLPMGTYVQFSNNLHVYTDVYDPTDVALQTPDNRYAHGITPMRMVVDPRQWLEELEWFLTDPLGDTYFCEPFFDMVAAPMYAAWSDHKRGASGMASALAIGAADWRVACCEWLQRAEERRRAATA